MGQKVRPCEICKELIDLERIELLPATRLCAKHAEEIEKYGGEFIYSTSKEGTGSKTAEGIVSRTKERNQEAVERLRDEFIKASFDK